MTGAGVAELSICMVTTFYPPHHFGGDALYVYRLTDALARRGHRVTVVHTPDAYETLGGRVSVHDFPHHPNVEVVPLETSFHRVSPLVTYLTGKPGLKMRALDKVFREREFDVTHFHNISLVGGPGILSHGTGIKLYTMHEHWLICPMHTLWKYNRRLCDKPAWLSCTLSYGRPPQLWRYTGLMERELSNVDLFFAPSRFTAAIHEERGFRHPIRHLPLFLSRDAATGGDAQLPPVARSRPYFLFVGRLTRIKGVETLIERFRTYTKADLLIAGDGDDADALRRRASGLDHVHFLGNLDTAALRPLYAHALALLVPSVTYEVFGYVSLEAFAQRTPVIVRDLGGAGEPVEDSGGGFAYRTEAELEQAMETIRTNPSLRDELGGKGYDGFVRLWTEDSHVDRYLAAIGELKGRPDETPLAVAESQ
jgi:glycosyltransferase involved in cell wall biosynthesis